MKQKRGSAIRLPIISELPLLAEPVLLAHQPAAAAPQPQQQAYMCVAQQPPTYAYAPAYAVNWNGMMYYM